MSALKCRATAIIALTGVDLSGKTGYLLKSTAGTHAVNDSATVPAVYLCIEGNTAARDSSAAALGAMEGTFHVKLGGTVAKGQRVQQKNDGTVEADAGPGTARVVVGVCLDGGAAGDLREVALFTPMILP